MTDYTIILSSRGFKFFGALQNVNISTVNYNDNLNSANNITFDVVKVLDGKVEPLWDKLQILDIIYVVEINQFYEIDVQFTDSTESKCIVTGTSMCESELGQTNLYNFDINNEKDANWLEAKNNNQEEYPPTVFYDEEHPEKSLLHRAINKIPHYKIGHVDKSLCQLQRSFSVDDKSVYDFFTGECSEQFNCLFEFTVEQQDGTYQRIINIYDLYVVCENLGCNYRGEYGEFLDTTTLSCSCPKCKGNELTYFGEDTTIYIDTENLTDEVKLTVNKDNIKNCFKLEAGDEIMTASIVGMNPNGSSYIYYFDPELKKDISQELQDLLNKYDADFIEYRDKYKIAFNSDELNIVNQYNNVVNKYSEKYEIVSDGNIIHPITNPIVGYANMMDYSYETIDLALYLQSSMMPTPHIQDEINANTEKNKLMDAYNSGDLKTVGISKVTFNTSTINAETAIKNWAKFFVKTGYVKLDINTKTFPDQQNPGTYVDSTGTVIYNYKTWTGTITIKNVADEEDFVTTNTLTIKICDDELDFINQKIKKELSSGDTDENNSMFNVLDYSVLTNGKVDANKLTQFKTTVLSQYSLNRLVSYRDAFEAVIDLLIAGNQSTTDSYLYPTLYLPYYEKLKACCEELDVRQNEVFIITGDTVNEIKGMQQILDKYKTYIQSQLDMQKYLGDYYNEFCSYRREQKYSNTNFISDGLTTSEISDNARKFYEKAQKEIIKAGTPQYSISATLYNLLKMKEFFPIKDKFKLGNWIRLKANDKVHRLRLITFGVNNSDETNINVEFSDVTVAPGVVNDVKSILSSTKSMASSYGYVQQQAEKGIIANDTVNKWINNGLDSALVSIKGNTHEQITVDNLGLTGKSYDDTIDDYEDEQVRLTHNILAFTDDGWRSVSLALGKHQYNYYDTKGILQSDIGYGLSSKFVQSGYVYGSQVIGGEIYSENYIKNQCGTYINLNDGDFSFAGDKIVYDSKKDTLNFTGGITVTNGYIGGDLVVGGNGTGKDGSILVKDLSDKTLIVLNKNGLTLDNSVKISYSNLSDTPTIPVLPSDMITNSNKGTYITKDYIETLKIKAYSVDAENITGTTISGKIISGSTINGGSASFTGTSFNTTKININYDSYNVKFTPSAIAFTATGKTVTLYGEIGNTCGMIASANDIYGSYYNDTCQISGSASFSKITYNSIYTGGSLSVKGTKSRIATTDTYGERLLYCYETPSPLFGDIGEGILDETGVCYVWLEDIFGETIDTDIQYQVFLQQYNNGECWISERTPYYFVVNGTPNLSFGWELKAVQNGYDTYRMEELQSPEERTEEVDILSELLNELYKPENEVYEYE